MNGKSFFWQLSGLSVLVGLLLTALHYTVEAAKPHAAFSLACLLLFIGICVGLYFAGANAARSTNKYAFTSLISVSVFGKMVIALAFLLAYRSIAHPENTWFVGIFLFCYAVYTIYEVVFMSKLAKQR